MVITVKAWRNNSREPWKRKIGVVITCPEL